MQLCRQTISSPLGDILLAADDRALRGLWFLRQKYFPVDATAWPEGENSVLRAAAEQLQRYFRGTLETFDLPLAFHEGTDFQRKTWHRLTFIPTGESLTYGEIAVQLGQPKASRAVGAAIGKNPISIIVPCHRVIGAQHRLTGYAGGLERKRWLLEHEARHWGRDSLRFPVAVA